MLVKVLNFGSNWWSRSGDGGDRRHAAYYNSTGVRCGSKIRRHWVVSGLLRFNGIADFNPKRPDRLLGNTFVCSDLTQAFGGNRLLFLARGETSVAPDCCLVVVSSREHGCIDFASPVWKSVFSRVIAASQLRNAQEIMLIMQAGDWIQTSAGFWQLHLPGARNQRPVLMRLGAPLRF